MWKSEKIKIFEPKSTLRILSRDTSPPAAASPLRVRSGLLRRGAVRCHGGAASASAGGLRVQRRPFPFFLFSRMLACERPETQGKHFETRKNTEAKNAGTSRAWYVLVVQPRADPCKAPLGEALSPLGEALPLFLPDPSIAAGTLCKRVRFFFSALFCSARLPPPSALALFFGGVCGSVATFEEN